MQTIKTIFTDRDIRNRILFTLIAFFIYRFGCCITVPGVDAQALLFGVAENPLLSLMNLLGGGGLDQMSVFALGVSPYITASIIVQLLSMDVIPSWTELAKEGANGRKKLDSYTRWMAVVFAFVQAASLVMSMNTLYPGVFYGTPGVREILFLSVILTAGTCFLTWLGDQISVKGIGNGISMIIMAGIVGRLPAQFLSAWQTLSPVEYGIWLFCGYVAVFVAIVLFVVLLSLAEYRIRVQYTSSSAKLAALQGMNYLPLKLNSASVIPVIFASALMMAPIQICAFFERQAWMDVIDAWLGMKTWYSLSVYAVLIVGFTFFYVKMQVNPELIAENLGKSGAYIPGVRPGKDTEKYINGILMRLTVVGSIALTLIALLPHVLPLIWPELPSSMALGGTGMIIVVGVAIETIKQIKGLVIQRSYKSYAEKRTV